MPNVPSLSSWFDGCDITTKSFDVGVLFAATKTGTTNNKCMNMCAENIGKPYYKGPSIQKKHTIDIYYIYIDSLYFDVTFHRLYKAGRVKFDAKWHKMEPPFYLHRWRWRLDIWWTAYHSPRLIYKLHICRNTPWKFNSSPLKIGRAPKGKACLPTIIFEGRAVSFREGKSTKQWWQLEIVSGNLMFHVGNIGPSSVCMPTNCRNGQSYMFQR